MIAVADEDDLDQRHSLATWPKARKRGLRPYDVSNGACGPQLTVDVASAALIPEDAVPARASNRLHGQACGFFAVFEVH